MQINLPWFVVLVDGSDGIIGGPRFAGFIPRFIHFGPRPLRARGRLPFGYLALGPRYRLQRDPTVPVVVRVRPVILVPLYRVV